MSERIHLFDLRERTSAKGNRYLAGWLGKASVVAFLDREAEEPIWQAFVFTPAPRSAGSTVPAASRSPLEPRQRRPRRTGKATLASGELDDAIDDL